MIKQAARTTEQVLLPIRVGIDLEFHVFIFRFKPHRHIENIAIFFNRLTNEKTIANIMKYKSD